MPSGPPASHILGDIEKRKHLAGTNDGHSEWPTIGFGFEQSANNHMALSKGGLWSKCYFQDIHVTAMCKMDRNSKKLQPERPANRSNLIRRICPASLLPQGQPGSF